MKRNQVDSIRRNFAKAKQTLYLKRYSQKTVELIWNELIKSETWADFMSSIVMNRWIEQFDSDLEAFALARNIGVQFCEHLYDQNASQHPMNADRIFKLYRQPNLRAALRCSGPPIEYDRHVNACNFQDEIPYSEYLP